MGCFFGCLLEDGNDLTGVHLIANADEDVFDDAVLGGFEGNFHFHGFENDHGITGFDAVAGFGFDEVNGSGNLGLDFNPGAAVGFGFLLGVGFGFDADVYVFTIDPGLVSVNRNGKGFPLISTV